MASHPSHRPAAPDLAAEAEAPDVPTYSQKELASRDSTATGGAAPPEIVVEESAEGIVLCQRYRLLEQLGAGAMGTVYRALDQKLDRQVAIKLLPERSVADPEAVARFRREAKALAKLSHPHIVQAYDADEDSGCHFLVMELVAGQTLAAVLREKGPLSPTRAATYGWQAALGLAHAHERGLVHRDFKPSNLIRTADGQVKILDLGLARFLLDQIGDATLTTEGLGMGTPDYTAHEQFRDARRADARSDIYSLGCTLYHLIAGRVPFPTSSLPEKLTAHEQQTPTPLDELCPDVPAGLAAAIGKMMAKRPEDRYQNALEAAEALAPYIASSSQALSGIKATASWHGSQAGPSVTTKRRRQRTLLAAAAGGVVTLAAVLLLTAWSTGLFSRPAEPKTLQVVQPPRVSVNPNVLTVGNGADAQYRTVREALDAVTHPDMEIDLLEGEHWGPILITEASKRAGLIIRSRPGATLRLAADGPDKAVIEIWDVPRVRIAGLRLSVQRSGVLGVFVNGQCPGLVLEELQYVAPANLNKTAGVSIENLALDPGQTPIVVQRCRFTGGYSGVQILGKDNASPEVRPIAGVRIQECSFEGCAYGVLMIGRVNRVLLAGNRIWNCRMGGLGFSELIAGSGQIDIFNNCVLAERACVNVEDFDAEVQDVELVNNLFVARSGPDLQVVAPPEKLTAWQRHHNWRQLPAGLVPALPAVGDGHGDAGVLSLQPTDADFLRPKPASPLAMGGAGGDLPTWIGAVPPSGTPAWDWQKVWDNRQPLTVSQGPTGAGRFRTIAEAVAAVKSPNTTIHILDSATYRDKVVIREERLSGLTIESPHGAKIETYAEGGWAIEISEVPRVTIRGLRLRSKGRQQILLLILKRAPGLLLEDLVLEGDERDYDGIQFRGVQNRADDPPAVVQNCVIRRPQVGINLHGVASRSSTSNPCSRIVLRNNQVQEPQRGLTVYGGAEQIQFVGNRVWGASQVGIQVSAGTIFSDVLIANNSCLMCGCGIMTTAFQAQPDGERVELVNNLVLAPVQADLLFLTMNAQADPNAAGDTALLRRHWTLRHNWREVNTLETTPDLEEAWIPLGPGDSYQRSIAVLSRSSDDPNFLRPAAGSPLATAGAGGDLPAYVGAVPPSDAPPWDWQQTWDSRHPKPITVSKDQAAGGDFRTIGDALRKAKLGMAVQILDDAVYEETISINNAAVHAGLIIESPRRATLQTGRAKASVIDIGNVPNVTIRGLTLRAEGPSQTLVMVNGMASGALLDNLQLGPGNAHDHDGIMIMAGLTPAAGPPIVVQNCTIREGQCGIGVQGVSLIIPQPPLSLRRVVLRNNRLAEQLNFGVAIMGDVQEVQVVGNVISGPVGHAGLQFQHLVQPRDVLVANNTFFNCGRGAAIRVWDSQIGGERIELAGNLILGSIEPDLTFVDSGGSLLTAKGPGDGHLVLQKWLVRANWRETPEPTGTSLKEQAWIPVGPDDQRHDQIDVISRDPQHAEFVRPAADSPLVTGGAGDDLPAYVGAVPPAGAPVWDWQQTWEKRIPTVKNATVP